MLEEDAEIMTNTGLEELLADETPEVQAEIIAHQHRLPRHRAAGRPARADPRGAPRRAQRVPHAAAARSEAVGGGRGHDARLSGVALRLPRPSAGVRQRVRGFRDEGPQHPVVGRLRPCRQLGRRVPAAAPRRRGLAGVHGALLEPHGLRRVARPLLSADDVREVITGIEERGVLGEVDAVLSGYQGGEDIGDVILDAVARVKAANPAATYTCDPVMGNAKSGCFVNPAIPAVAARARGSGRRPHHAQPVRARVPHRNRSAHARRDARVCRPGAGDGSVDRARHERRATRLPRPTPSRCSRSTTTAPGSCRRPGCRSRPTARAT